MTTTTANAETGDAPDGPASEVPMSGGSLVWADAAEATNAGAAGSALLGGVQQAIAVLTGLAGVSLAGLSEDDLCRVVNATEQLGRLVDALRTEGAGEVAVQSRRELGLAGLAAKNFQRTPAEMLVFLTRVSVQEAGRRVRLAEHITSRRSLTGDLPPLFPLVGAAVREGRIGVEAATSIVTGLRKAQDGAGDTLHPDAISAAEQDLVETAATEPVLIVTDRVAVWRDALDPDGVQPRDEDARGRRSFTRGTEIDGITKWILFTPAVATGILTAILEEAEAGHTPRFLPTDDQDQAVQLDGLDPDPDPEDQLPTSGIVVTDDGEPVDASRIVDGTVDTRTIGQRNHDVLLGFITAGMRADESETGGMRSTAQVIAITTLADLQAGRGTGWIEGATAPVSMRTIRELACESGGVQTIILGNAGETLYLGPVPRFFNPAQKRALLIRDGGCAVTGCTMSAHRSQAHHIVSWKADGRGGGTDINNGASYKSALFNVVKYPT